MLTGYCPYSSQLSDWRCQNQTWGYIVTPPDPVPETLLKMAAATGDWLLAESKPPAGGGQEPSGGGQHYSGGGQHYFGGGRHYSGGAVARTSCPCQLALKDECHICGGQVHHPGVQPKPDSLAGHEAAGC